jgi:hypothetical protein
MSKVNEKEKPLPRSMTVGQYLKRFPNQKPGVEGLLRSLYSQKTASKEDWDKIATDLLSRPVK